MHFFEQYKTCKWWGQPGIEFSIFNMPANVPAELSSSGPLET
jgi:hypothetical protein